MLFLIFFSSQNIILFKFYAQIDIKLLLRMRCTFHIHTTLICNSFYCNQNIIAIWSHNFNCLAYTEFITLFYMIKSLCILFADNAKICIFLNICICIIYLCIFIRFTEEKSGCIRLYTVCMCILKSLTYKMEFSFYKDSHPV